MCWVLAFEGIHVVDVTRRYVEDHEALEQRRKNFLSVDQEDFLKEYH
jgi:hypothetical protein